MQFSLLAISCTVVVGAFSASLAVAQGLSGNAGAPAKVSPDTATVSVSSTPAGSGGLMVFIDPVTKQIRQPSPGEVEQLQASAVAQPSPSDVIARQPIPPLVGVGVGLMLDESTHSHVVLTKTKDGTTQMDCLPTATQAVNAVTRGTRSDGTAHGSEAHDVK